MDMMYIRNLRVACIIGTRPAERIRRQPLVLNIELECDLRKAGLSDCITDTVNYSKLAQAISAMVRRSSFLLIERMAAEVADLCLADPRVVSATVTVDKPRAIKLADSAAVKIRRARK